MRRRPMETAFSKIKRALLSSHSRQAVALTWLLAEARRAAKIELLVRIITPIIVSSNFLKNTAPRSHVHPKQLAFLVNICDTSYLFHYGRRLLAAFSGADCLYFSLPHLKTSSLWIL